MQETIINTFFTGFCTFVMLSVYMLYMPVVQAGENDVARYIGQINEEQNRKLFSSISGRKVSRLVITSSGGEVEAAIKLGIWAYKNKIDIEVPEYCLSSCANYVFPAGYYKKIHKGAIVAWHGNYHHLKKTGLWQDEVERKVELYGMEREIAAEQVLSQVNRLVRMEREFFQEIGVNEFICWIGKLPPYVIPDYYFLSRQDMEQFGITNLSVPAAYEHTDVSDFTVSISFIQLNKTVVP